MKNLALTSILWLFYGGMIFSQSLPVDSMYFGQTPPGTIRKKFNLTADQNYYAVEKMAISPDGKEIYYEETNSNWTSYKFKYYKYYNNKWNGPFNLFNDFYCLSLSPDGNLMYFEKNSYQDGWVSVKQDTIWNSPSRLLKKFHVHSLNVTSLGNYYMSSNPAGVLGQRDICKLIIGNSDTTLVGLGLPLNSSANEGDFFISNDESFIIVMSNKSGGLGSTDLYISFKKSNDTWTNPKNMGTSVNTSSDDFGPYVTMDNKYLFYESGYSSPSSIYWIKVDELIDNLKHTNFDPYLKSVIANQSDTVGKLFNYTIPDSIFIDDDGNNTLTYGAKLSNGNSLPTWLSFNSTTRTFSGTPTIVENLNIRITATDNAGKAVSATFNIGGVTSVHQIKEQDVRIFPNPTNGQVNISLDALSGKKAKVEISNLEGKLIFSNSYQNLTVTTINLKNNPYGIYILKLTIDGDIVIKKICLE
jgi:hypothetical protein